MTATLAPLTLIGRSSSHFTRVTRLFAHELGVPIELVPVRRLLATEPDAFGGNPALKLPSLRRPDGALLFGTENICRAIAAHAGDPPGLVWPETIADDLVRNAHELTWHAMAAQVQLIVGTGPGDLPADHRMFVKIRRGLEGALGWLDHHLADAQGRLPPARRLSLLEVALFCLLEHLVFRPTLPALDYPALAAFAAGLAARPSAQATTFHFDP